MAQSSLSTFQADSVTGFDPVTYLRRWVWKMAVATLVLMAIGSATRVMNAGLACPDWPLCYGQLVPSQQMNLQVFLEWFHRLDASLIGLMAIGLITLSIRWRRSLDKWVPWTAGFVLFLVVFQGILGGLTVTQLLRFDIVTAHLGTALLVFCTLLAMGMGLLPYKSKGTAGKLSWLSGVAMVLVYGQSLLGGLVGSRWAAHQCFGLAELCGVVNAHLLGIIPASLAVILLAIFSWRTTALDVTLRFQANLAFGLLILQLILGLATFRLHLQVEPLTVCHQAVGASLLGTLVCFTVLSLRDSSLSEENLKPSVIR
ncbi:MAG: heme A synthase [Leptolyngbya sp. SIO3F4]|nr:heme A synthase [Leptolyngbya sp. SIO3F4]